MIASYAWHPMPGPLGSPERADVRDDGDDATTPRRDRDAKLHYNFWRPITSSRTANKTQRVPRPPRGEPFINPQPSGYPCGHCMFARRPPIHEAEFAMPRRGFRSAHADPNRQSMRCRAERMVRGRSLFANPGCPYRSSEDAATRWTQDRSARDGHDYPRCKEKHAAASAALSELLAGL